MEIGTLALTAPGPVHDLSIELGKMNAPPAPLALIEVGASAGLCLLMDRYYYDYGDRQLGNAASPVQLECRLSGSPPVPGKLPNIAWRAGIDLNPVDLQDEEDVRWILSCVFADQPARRARLERAVEVGRAFPPGVRQGDLLTDLSSLINKTPSEAQLVIFHSAVLCYVKQEDRCVFAEALTDASRRRDIIWISNESPGVVEEITALSPTLDLKVFLLGRTTFRQGSREDELLALTHYHGASLEWLGTENAGLRNQN